MTHPLASRRVCKQSRTLRLMCIRVLRELLDDWCTTVVWSEVYEVPGNDWVCRRIVV